MLSLSPIIAQLKTKPAGFKSLWFKQVAGAAEYAQIRPESLPLPACWVVRSAEKSSHAGERAENLNVGFDVVIAIENVRTHVAGSTDDMLLEYRQAVKTLLLGWQIELDVRPIRFEGGRVLQYTDGDLYWADHYSFDAVITNYLDDPYPFESLNYTGEPL
ncbi:MAG: hypothetical protein HOP06_10140 [Methylotenera sp.]|nr:hypothetical protein [Methylotenera sp.]